MYHKIGNESAQSSKKIKKSKKIEDDVKKTFQKVDYLSQWIDAIEENTKICDGILNNSLLHISPELQTKLNNTFENSETISFNVATKLKEFRNDLDKPEMNKQTTEYRMKYLQYTSLDCRFKDALHYHRVHVEKHRDIRKELLLKCDNIVNGRQMDEEELEKLIDNNKLTQVFVKDYLSKVKEEKVKLGDLTARHDELISIETHLEQVRDLFTKIALLIEEQHESIDRIEYHALSATDHIDSTMNELESARRSKRKRSKKIIYIILALALAIPLIAIPLCA